MKQWLSDFKLALIQEDVNKLENLLDELDMKAFIKNLAKESPSEDFLKENANDVFLSSSSSFARSCYTD